MSLICILGFNFSGFKKFSVKTKPKFLDFVNTKKVG